VYLGWKSLQWYEVAKNVTCKSFSEVSVVTISCSLYSAQYRVVLPHWAVLVSLKF
jgi:hypothetical protein